VASRNKDVCVIGVVNFSRSSLQLLSSYHLLAQPPLQWILRTFSAGVKRLDLVADHSPPSSAGAEMLGALPSLPIKHL
jgi:hypothetical protein